ncbi:MAG: STAS domain-containing protein [Thermodesulfobacteriota bacterium]|nr:MAG: STAS domain-containing protein [Thermodesulfobacteriota bacterium]
MEIQIRRESKATVVTVTGRMDTLTAPAYQTKLNDLIAEEITSFVIDFAGLDYISSAGLRVILSTAKVVKGKGGQVSFANLKGTVREVFEVSGFGSLFPMYDSVAVALSEIG